MSLYREFPWVPWVPWDSHGNRKYYSSSVGMRKSMRIAWWEWAGMTTLHFTIYHSEQAIKLISLRMRSEERPINQSINQNLFSEQ